MALRGKAVYPTAVSEWLVEDRLTPASKKQYRMVLRMLQDEYPGKRVNEFTTQDLVRFLSNGKRSDATVKNYRSAIVRFFKWAHRRGMTRQNPAADLVAEIRPGNGTVRHGVWLSRDDVDRLFAACDTSSPRGLRDALVLNLALFTGLRRAELCALSWGAVDLHNRSLNVLGKGGKAATIGIPKQLGDLLVEWKAIYERPVAAAPVLVRVKWNQQTQERSLLWGCALQPPTLWHIVGECAERAGVRKCAPHDLRRSFASFLEDQGRDLVQIQAAMRHSSPDTTFRHYLVKDPKRAIAATADFVL